MISLPQHARPSGAAIAGVRIINVDEDDEVRQWAKQFGVSDLRVRVAVARVGPLVDNVIAELGSPPWPEEGGW
jgi:hypothetical protein